MPLNFCCNKEVHLKFISIFLIFLLSFNAFAQDKRVQQAEQALAKLDAINTHHWSYKHLRQSDDESTLSYFDPRKPIDQQWQLILINSLVPSIEQLTEFNAIWNSEELDEVDSSQAPVSAMITPNSLSYSHQQGDVAIFSFSPIVDDMPDQQDKLTGELYLNLSSGDITELTIKNTEPLAAAFSMQLDAFKMSFEFIRIKERFAYRRISLIFSGTVGYVKEISQHSIEEFSEYIYVGEKANID